MRRKRGCIYVCALKKKKEKKSVGERSQAPCEIKQSQKKGDGEDFEIRVRRMWLCANEEKMARGVQDLLEKFQEKKPPQKKDFLHACTLN